MKATVRERQSVLDIAVQETGDLAGVFEIARRNDVSITEPVEAGALLRVGKPVDKVIAKVYAEKRITPATEISEEERNAVPFGGIGYMGVEIDFIVS